MSERHPPIRTINNIENTFDTDRITSETRLIPYMLVSAIGEAVRWLVEQVMGTANSYFINLELKKTTGERRERLVDLPGRFVKVKNVFGDRVDMFEVEDLIIDESLDKITGGRRVIGDRSKIILADNTRPPVYAISFCADDDSLTLAKVENLMGLPKEDMTVEQINRALGRMCGEEVWSEVDRMYVPRHITWGERPEEANPYVIKPVPLCTVLGTDEDPEPLNLVSIPDLNTASLPTIQEVFDEIRRKLGKAA